MITTSTYRPTVGPASRFRRPLHGVEYRVTELGRSLNPVFDALHEWTETHIDEVYAARAAFDS